MSSFVLPAYGSNGYNGYGAQPRGGESHTSQSLEASLGSNAEYKIFIIICVYSVLLGYNGGYGNAGLGLGPRYGNGAMKGPKQGGTTLTFKENEYLYDFRDLCF